MRHAKRSSFAMSGARLALWPNPLSFTGTVHSSNTSKPLDFMFWVVLTGSKRQPDLIMGDTLVVNREVSNQMRVYDRIEDAHERKAFIEEKWPHLAVWVVRLDYE